MIKRGSGERGGALLLAVIISMSVVAISGAFISHSMIKAKGSADSMMGLQALAAAESGAVAQVQWLNMAKHNTYTGTVPSGVAFQKFVNEATGYSLQTQSVNSDFTKLWVTGFSGGQWEGTTNRYKGGSKRTLEVILTGKTGGAFWNAVFAGNKGPNGEKDPNFKLSFGSGFDQNGNNVFDRIKGDVYSGGSLRQFGDAQMLNANGSGPAAQVMYEDTLDASAANQTPPPTYVQGTQPDLDIAAMNYSQLAAESASGNLAYSQNGLSAADVVNVSTALDGTDARFSVGLEANGFVANGNGSQGAAGSAEAQINKNFAMTNPAHLFRKNVTDSGDNRAHVDYGTPTPKNDYFLEDSSTNYGNGSPQGNWLGSDGGQMLDVHPTGNDKVYFIDGNLWLANSPTFTFQFKNKTTAEMKITIIVKGNVYLCDNLLYERDSSGNIKNPLDGIALIAINDSNYKSATADSVMTPGGIGYDPANVGLGYAALVDKARNYNRVNGSGNIFFGDPAGGTTERFESFLYAENNFYDNNLGANGTNMTNIYGNMTAGNQVQITRNSTNYKPTKVDFDQRIQNGTIDLPGLPGNPSSAGQDWRIVSWRQVPSKD